MTAASPSPSTAKSTITKRCARPSSPAATAFAVTATPRFCSSFTAPRAKISSAGCAAACPPSCAGRYAADALGAPLHPKHAELLTYGSTLPGAYLLQRGLFLPPEACEAWADPAVIEEGLARLDPARLLAQPLTDGPCTPFAQVAALEASLYMRNQLLRDADWGSMAHSLEVRTPLVDRVLLERLAPVMLELEPGSGKTFLGAAPSKPLPAAVTGRCKTGFGIPIER